jgi:vacuolar-type H+-ATPase subunit I/STV1
MWTDFGVREQAFKSVKRKKSFVKTSINIGLALLSLGFFFSALTDVRLIGRRANGDQVSAFDVVGLNA